jgi:alpha-acetolactate decarboxylase
MAGVLHEQFDFLSAVERGDVGVGTSAQVDGSVHYRAWEGAFVSGKWEDAAEDVSIEFVRLLASERDNGARVAYAGVYKGVFE